MWGKYCLRTVDQEVFCASGPDSHGMKLVLTSATDLAAVGNEGCAVLVNGTVACWGVANQDGQLGMGSFGSFPDDERFVPREVIGLLGVRRISTGNSHRCALLTDGSIWCWGYNVQGQLGDGTKESRAEPMRASQLANIVDVSAAGNNSCALGRDGVLWCWGQNFYGQVGTEANGDTFAVPQQVTSLTGVSQVSVGDANACAVLTDGSTWCWGQNDSGQLGADTPDRSGVPLRLPRLHGPRAISAGRTSCAVTSEGSMVCWGLGFGTDPRPVDLRVQADGM